MRLLQEIGRINRTKRAMVNLGRSSSLWAALVLACGDSSQADRAQTAWEGSIDSTGTAVVVQNPPHASWPVGREWKVVPELTIGSIGGTGPDVFGRVTALAVSADGEIAVLDAQASEIRVFDARGAHVRTVGREGAGPGEFRGALSVHYDSRDRMWVPESENARYSVFDSVGNFITSFRRTAGTLIGNPGVLTSEDVLIDLSPVLLEDRVAVIPIRFDTKTESVDSLPPILLRMRPSTPSPAALVPYSSRVVLTVDLNGDFWSASTESPVLHEQAPNGDTVRVVHLPLNPVPLSQDDEDSIAAIIAAWRFPVDRGELGVGPQIIQGIYPDDAGHVFVRTRGEESSVGVQFQVIDSIGRYLGPMTSPVNFSARPRPLFRNGYVYGVVLDSLGVASVVRARIDKPGGTGQ